MGLLDLKSRDIWQKARNARPNRHIPALVRFGAQVPVARCHHLVQFPHWTVEFDSCSDCLSVINEGVSFLFVEAYIAVSGFSDCFLHHQNPPCSHVKSFLSPDLGVHNEFYHKTVKRIYQNSLV